MESYFEALIDKLEAVNVPTKIAKLLDDKNVSIKKKAMNAGIATILNRSKIFSYIVPIGLAIPESDHKFVLTRTIKKEKEKQNPAFEKRYMSLIGMDYIMTHCDKSDVHEETVEMGKMVLNSEIVGWKVFSDRETYFHKVYIPPIFVRTREEVNIIIRRALNEKYPVEDITMCKEADYLRRKYIGAATSDTMSIDQMMGAFRGRYRTTRGPEEPTASQVKWFPQIVNSRGVQGEMRSPLDSAEENQRDISFNVFNYIHAEATKSDDPRSAFLEMMSDGTVGGRDIDKINIIGSSPGEVIADALRGNRARTTINTYAGEVSFSSNETGRLKQFFKGKLSWTLPLFEEMVTLNVKGVGFCKFSHIEDYITQIEIWVDSNQKVREILVRAMVYAGMVEDGGEKSKVKLMKGLIDKGKLKPIGMVNRENGFYQGYPGVWNDNGVQVYKKSKVGSDATTEYFEVLDDLTLLRANGKKFVLGAEFRVKPFGIDLPSGTRKGNVKRFKREFEWILTGGIYRVCDLIMQTNFNNGITKLLGSNVSCSILMAYKIRSLYKRTDSIATRLICLPALFIDGDDVGEMHGGDGIELSYSVGTHQVKIWDGGMEGAIVELMENGGLENRIHFPGMGVEVEIGKTLKDALKMMYLGNGKILKTRITKEFIDLSTLLSNVKTEEATKGQSQYLTAEQYNEIIDFDEGIETNYNWGDEEDF